MRLKKKLTMLFTCVLLLSILVGCKSNDAVSSKKEEPTTSDFGNTLVVYYSASGNTKEVATMIKESTKGDLFEIEPKEPYSDDDLKWTNDNSRVTKEYKNESERNIELISTTVENWDTYDTIFIGYPIWWGIAAWPVDNIVKNNDFTGKKVIPFCTSSSSGLGESGDLLSKMAGTGDWQQGERFRSGVSSSDVQNWIHDLTK